MPSPRILAMLAATALALACGPAPAEIYRCVGKDGQVTYSQTRPASGSCGNAKVSAPQSSGANGGDLMKFSKEIDKDHAAQAKDQQKTDQAQAQRERGCRQSRARLATLEQVNRIFTVDEKGERHYSSDAEKDAETSRVRQEVAEYCR